MKPHVCFAIFAAGTLEHIVQHASILESHNIEFCYLVFSDSKFADKSIESSILALARSWQVRNQLELKGHLKEKSTLLVVQSPYEEHYPEWFWPSTAESKSAYFGYGISMSSWTNGHYKLEVFNKLNFIACNNPFEFVGMLRHHPKSAITARDELLSSIHKDARKYHVSNSETLWAPHWSQEWFEKTKGYSRFLESIDVVTEYLQNNPNRSITFRPHPILAQAIGEMIRGVDSRSREVISVRVRIEPRKAEIERLYSLQNFTVSTSSLRDDILSHIRLLTDGISIIGYWSITGKEIAIMRDSESPDLNTLGKVLVFFLKKINSENELKNWLSARPRAGMRSDRRIRSAFFQGFFYKSGGPVILKVIRRVR